MKTQTKHSPEVRERAVRLVLEHQGEHDSHWATIGSIAAKIGRAAETVRRWVRQAERDLGQAPGLIPPAKLEHSYYQQQQESAKAA